MTTRHHDRVRAALQRLATARAAQPHLPPLPLLVRTPFLIAFWTLLLVIAAATLAVGRVLLPHLDIMPRS